ncbi:sugar transferase [Desulfobacter hydrogenophilus]|uniref:Sugar transferase n=1 Tax=Desulfobacter hydrogenophilus TaxID=2291 RepID=A0A328FD22_9BACT|nr:sugar transferase [Desulfobacter hydrogenophilus]NDY74119.1 sugar transferase [Desulfobacter hydrogenophilus]QBH14079.1 sugar transferase [Desulfobacter hydrogenophilus]RAM01640.1 sugar transferase [Desulfobacter hydrogenophilus]
MANNTQNLKLTTFRLIWVDFILIGLSFFVINHTKRDSFHLPEGYGRLLVLFYLCWVLSGLVGKKFLPGEYRGYLKSARVLLKSGLYLTYMIVFLVVMLGLSQYSRVQVLATCGMLFLVEIVIWSAGYRYVVPFAGPTDDPEAAADEERPAERRSPFSYRFLGLDFILLVTAFFAVYWLKQGRLALPPGYDRLGLILVGVWFGLSLAGKKFNLIGQKNLYFALWQWIKTGLFMLAVFGVLVFGFRMFQYSRLQGFGTIVVFIGLEWLALLLYFSTRKYGNAEPDIQSVGQVRKMIHQEAYDLNVDLETVRSRMMAPCTHKLRRFFESDNPSFFNFLSAHVVLQDIRCVESMVDRSCDPFTLRDDHLMLRLYVSIHKINDCRRLNAHFLQLHQMMMPGGYFAGYAHTIRTHRDWIYGKYPRQLAHVVYLLDFMVHRVIPKLPWVQKVYFAVTKGKNRVISQAEVLGRLCFCGFEIVATENISNRLHFIARKVKTSSLDRSPTYGPLVALKRSGFGGGVVNTYKFRTMHPYSEYLQQYMYDLNGLQKGGKIENDFRMTTWGKVMRKLWIDELPMFYNWFKGDFGLVGVRPLSFQYLSLYDADLQELRKKVRPGLIPPFYADLPETFEEICDSERRYIRAFLDRPIRTQIVYFWKSFVNIAIKGARSK